MEGPYRTLPYPTLPYPNSPPGVLALFVGAGDSNVSICMYGVGVAEKGLLCGRVAMNSSVGMVGRLEAFFA